MNVLKMLAANAPATGNQTLYQIINGLGLTTNLKLCLDAGDAASYDPAVQNTKWLDTSGNGFDFFRGTSTGGDSAEPTFNGSAGGLSSNEYFSFDGADYFTYDTTTEAWMNTLHKDGAICTILAIFYPASSAVQRIFATRSASGTGSQGIVFGKSVTTNLTLFNSFNATTASSVTSTTAQNVSSWNVFSVAIDENGTNRAVFNTNGTSETNTTYSYTSPSASNITGTPKIGAFTDLNIPVSTGSRLACLAIWEGTALTATNLTDLYNGIKGRFEL